MNKGDRPLAVKRAVVTAEDTPLRVARQCALLGMARSRWYCTLHRERPEHLDLMRRLDEEDTRTPVYGIRRRTAGLRQQGYTINHKRVGRLLRRMGVEALSPKPRLSVPGAQEQRYPYVLLCCGAAPSPPSTTCGAPISPNGFLYVVAVRDWDSRYVVAWELSNTRDTGFCLTALAAALAYSWPAIFNTEQGVQVTRQAYTSRLEQAGIQIRWDGRGRALDTVFVERRWRSVKWEQVYLKDYQTVAEAVNGLDRYLRCYTQEWAHHALGYQTPAQVYGVAA